MIMVIIHKNHDNSNGNANNAIIIIITNHSHKIVNNHNVNDTNNKTQAWPGRRGRPSPAAPASWPCGARNDHKQNILNIIINNDHDNNDNNNNNDNNKLTHNSN